MRLCSKCGIEKPLASFYVYDDRHNDNHCRDCISIYQKAYYKKNRVKRLNYQRAYNIAHPEKQRERGKRWRGDNSDKLKADSRLRLYGLTQEAFDALIAVNGVACWICKRPGRIVSVKEPDAICIDHDHETGEVRGLLCKACNTGIGLLKDDIELLKKAIAFLRQAKRRHKK